MILYLQMPTYFSYFADNSCAMTGGELTIPELKEGNLIIYWTKSASQPTNAA